MGVYLGQSVYNDSQVTPEWVDDEIAANQKVSVFECQDNGTDQNFFTGPTYDELEAARTSGKAILLLVHCGFDTVVDRYLRLTHYGFDRNAFNYIFTGDEGRALRFSGIVGDVDHYIWSRDYSYDDTLSSTSYNAVKNSTLYNAIDKIKKAPAQAFVPPSLIYGGPSIPNGNSGLYLANIRDKFSIVLIGLRPLGGLHLTSGSVFEVVTDSLPAFGNIDTLLSMGLFKIVGLPRSGSSDPVTFRRLSVPLAPRSIVGVRNDGGTPEYGQDPSADNPIMLEIDEDAQFNNGELLFLGIAVAFNGNLPDDSRVFICATPKTPVYDYNNPINCPGPVYCAYGQSDKISAGGFTSREFTINFSYQSIRDFEYATSFDSNPNAFSIGTGGISPTTMRCYPIGFRLLRHE